MSLTTESFEEGRVFTTGSLAVHVRAAPISPYGNVLERLVELAVLEVPIGTSERKVNDDLGTKSMTLLCAHQACSPTCINEVVKGDTSCASQDSFIGSFDGCTQGVEEISLPISLSECGLRRRVIGRNCCVRSGG